uniref:sperm acrosome membrane-associated protein 6 isoform X5 n=1 Tax=Halichoerus grypus TaxID=9711 RepID=UPI001658F53A|nr:sperm acrosome membrane-associated protein 6 isoform X5 [Halichoerus grypus]
MKGGQQGWNREAEETRPDLVGPLVRNLIFILPFPLNKINAEDAEEGFHQKDSPEADGRRLGDLSAFQAPLRWLFLMLRRKCGRSLCSLKKSGPASLPADSRKSPGVSTAAGATPRSATSRWTAQLPQEEITYSWKFAGGGVRTQDVSYFEDLPRARGNLARIRPVQPAHRGTFSCVILHDQIPLARLYFFLNVTGAPPRGETELQVSFREVLRWAPLEAEMIEPWRPSLGELLARPEALTLSNQCLLAAVAALASVSATLVVWMFFRWYFKGN